MQLSKPFTRQKPIELYDIESGRPDAVYTCEMKSNRKAKKMSQAPLGCPSDALPIG